MSEINCKIYGLSRPYASGIERAELYVCTADIDRVPMPKPKQRTNIIFSTRHGDYKAGLRAADGRWTYVCPDLVGTNLATVLRNAGKRKGEIVRVSVTGGRWRLL
jgi:hypothetical protein